MAVSFVAASSQFSNVSGTCPKPTGTLATDLMVFAVNTVEKVPRSISLSGWTELWNETHVFFSDVILTWACYVGPGSLAAPTPLVAPGGPYDHTMVCATFRGVDLTDPVVGIGDLATGSAFGSFRYSPNTPDPLTGAHYVGVMGVIDNVASAQWNLRYNGGGSTTPLTHRVTRFEADGQNSSLHLGSGDSPAGSYPPAGGWQIGSVAFDGGTTEVPATVDVGGQVAVVDQVAIRSLLLRPA